jgi:hypothetical protein
MQNNNHNFKEEISLSLIDILIKMLKDDTKNVKKLAEKVLLTVAENNTNKEIKIKLEKISFILNTK